MTLELLVQPKGSGVEGRGSSVHRPLRGGYSERVWSVRRRGGPWASSVCTLIPATIVTTLPTSVRWRRRIGSRDTIRSLIAARNWSRAIGSSSQAIRSGNGHVCAKIRSCGAATINSGSRRATVSTISRLTETCGPVQSQITSEGCVRVTESHGGSAVAGVATSKPLSPTISPTMPMNALLADPIRTTLRRSDVPSFRLLMCRPSNLVPRGRSRSAIQPPGAGRRVAADARGCSYCVVYPRSGCAHIARLE